MKKKLKQNAFPISKLIDEIVSGADKNVVAVNDLLLTGLNGLMDACRGNNDLTEPATKVLLAHRRAPHISTPGNRRPGAENYWRGKLNLILRFCQDIVGKDWEPCCQDEAPADAIAA